MNRILLQQALNALLDANNMALMELSIDDAYSDEIKALEAELAKPEQEPVAWAAKSIYGDFEGLSFEKQPRFDTPLYALEVTK